MDRQELAKRIAEIRERVAVEIGSGAKFESLIPGLKIDARTLGIKLRDLLPEYFWNPYQTLTHNALVNLIVGNRGGGKTYGVKERSIDNFIKKGEQFGYIRRYKDDLQTSMPTYFDDIYEEYPDYEFKVEGAKFYIRERTEDKNKKWTKDDIAGYGFVLSTANNKKSVSFPKITTLQYDEFLLEKGSQKYLPREVEKLLNLYETIARPGSGHPRVVLWLMANAVTEYNPYFLYWDIQMPTTQDKNGKWIWKHPSRPILVEDVRIAAFIEAKKNSEFGQLVAGTNYADYSIENKFLLDNNTFVSKKSPRARHAFNFAYLGANYGVWFDYSEGKMWVSEMIDPSGVTYSFTIEDHKPNMMLFKSRNKSYYLKAFFDAFKQGNLFFETVTIKNMCFDIFKVSMF